jgi:hypothetical protein
MGLSVQHRRLGVAERGLSGVQDDRQARRLSRDEAIRHHEGGAAPFPRVRDEARKAEGKWCSNAQAAAKASAGRIVSLASSISAQTLAAKSRKIDPASVRAAPRVDRASSCTPSPSSSLRRRRLTIDDRLGQAETHRYPGISNFYEGL